MKEIAQQFREELQEIVDRYKTRLSVPRIMHVAQDVFHKNLSIKCHPELHIKEINGLKIPAELLEDPDHELKKMMQGEFIRDETMKEMAEKYAKTNRHYVIAKRENGADYAKEVSSVTIEQAYFAGLKDLNDIHNENFTRAKEIIKNLLQVLPKESIEGAYKAATKAAEESIRETEAMAEDSWQSKCLGYKINADESVYKTGFLDGYSKANGDTKCID